MAFRKRIFSIRNASLIGASILGFAMVSSAGVRSALAAASQGCIVASSTVITNAAQITSLGTLTFNIGEVITASVSSGPPNSITFGVVGISGQAFAGIPGAQTNFTVTQTGTINVGIGSPGGPFPVPAPTITLSCSQAGPTVPPPPTITPNANSGSLIVGGLYQQTFTVADGTAPYFGYSLASGTLPTGTQLNGNTGVVSGTLLAAGTFDYSVAVFDSSAPNRQAFSLTVHAVIQAANASVALTSNVNPSTFGQSVTFQATVSGAGAPTGTVTFKDGTAILGTSNIVGGIATFVTSALSTGAHSITATYNGDAGNNPMTSAALVQTVNVPADSAKLRNLQIMGTQVAAQASSQAIAGAIENAVEVGLGDGIPGGLTPNGSGFTYYVDGGSEQRGLNGENDVKSFMNSPDRRTNRVDDGFSALGYRDAPSKGRPAPGAPREWVAAREWLAWFDFRGMSVDRNTLGSDLKGDQMVGLAGLTRRFSSNIVAGLLGGYERFNFTSDALTGRLKGDGWTAGGYLGWRFGSVRASFGVTHSWIGYDAVAGLASGTFKGDRWLMSGGLTGAYGMNALILEPSVRVYAMWENEKGYTDSLGIAQDARTFFTGRASAGNKVSYPVSAMPGTIIAPYVGLYADYYFSHDDAAFSGLASTPVLSGWSARVTGGFAMRGDNGAQLDLGGEYGGIGGDTKIWTWRARGKLPF
jgi:hypothetical protein